MLLMARRRHSSITDMRGLFRGSQLNWDALTKNVCVIYMSIKKLSLYLDDSHILSEVSTSLYEDSWKMPLIARLITGS